MCRIAKPKLNFPLGQIGDMSEATIDTMMGALQRLKDVRP